MIKKIIFTFFLTLFTIFLSVIAYSKIVYSKSDLKSTKIGFPLYFIDKDQSQLDPPYPYKIGAGSLNDDPQKILWLNLLIDFVLIFSFYDLLLNRTTLFLKKKGGGKK